MLESDQIFARQTELARLEAYLEQAMQSAGQVCFITGEAGTGKSALAYEFARLAQEKFPELVISAAGCDPQIGEAAAYAPFRDIMTALSGGNERADAKPTPHKSKNAVGTLSLVAETIVEFGPDLINIFVPGAVLISLGAKIGGFALGRTGWMDKLKAHLDRRERGQKLLDTSELTQDQILEQYVNVLRAISEKRPTVLILDDLHWADAASVNLFFRLCRRLQDCRLLLVGTYRPNELTAGEHPLAGVLTELKRYYGEAWLDLDRAKARHAAEFVDALVDSEPNHLGEAFRRKLLEQTGGHPLFTVELLRDLQERGRLVKDAGGAWVIAEQIAWEALPLRVEGVIENRIMRLEDSLREYLNIGSVEGEQFTVEVIAQVQSRETRDLVRQFSGQIQKVYQLVEALDVKRIAQQRISRYRFAHNLFQHYLYHHLDPVELSFLHEEVGLALEALYGEAAFEIAPQLGRHFELAGLAEQACKYLHMAAEQAAAGFANQSALAYYTHALALHDPADTQLSYELLMGRQRVYALLGKHALQETDLDELDRLLAEMPGDHARHAQVTLERGGLALNLSQFDAAIEFARQSIQWTRDGGDDQELLFVQVEGQLLWGRALSLSGQLRPARQQLESGLDTSRRCGYLPGEMRSLELLGTLEWRQGNYPQAQVYLGEALQLAHDSGNLRREYSVLNNLGVLHTALKDYPAAAGYYEQAIKIVRQIGDRRGEVFVLSNLGEVHLYIGDYVQVQVYTTEALSIAREIGDPLPQGIILANLSEAFRETGDYTQAKIHGQESLQILSHIRYRMGEAIALENLARIDFALGDLRTARDHARRALATSEEIEARSNQAAVQGLLGDVLYALGEYVPAGDAYRQASAIWDEIGDQAGYLHARAGLARIAIAAQPPDAAAALEYVGPVLREVLGEAGGDLAGKLPMSVYLACVCLLDSLQDPRATAVAKEAKAELQRRAERIHDPVVRFSFLENVPANLEIRRRAGLLHQ